jgi:integrase
VLIADSVFRWQPKGFVDSDHLFVHRKGSKLLPYSEKGTGFDRQVKDKITAQTGIKVKNHTLRRTWGRETHYRGGVSLADLAKIYGHSSEVMTMNYIGVDKKRMTEVMKKIPY